MEDQEKHRLLQPSFVFHTPQLTRLKTSHGVKEILSISALAIRFEAPA